MKKPDWEGAQRSSVDTKQSTSSNDESPAKLGETATERKDQSGYSKDSTPQIGPQSCWKILLIICRSQKNQTQAQSFRAVYVNQQLHPKMKPAVAGSYGNAA